MCVISSFFWPCGYQQQYLLLFIPFFQKQKIENALICAINYVIRELSKICSFALKLLQINDFCASACVLNRSVIQSANSSCFDKIFHYTRCIKCVTSFRSPSSHHCARTIQLFLKKCYSDGEPLATVRPIWQARDLNLRPPTSETNAVLLDQLVG